ncbi:MAG TPA: hypothetical protein VEB21_07080 [Terriglobales bacterium]|nr:hypothetical protein [Terriglobales bacterium]
MTRTGTRTPTGTFTTTPSKSPTPSDRGPQIVFLGIVRNADGCVSCCEEECLKTPTPAAVYDDQGRRVYDLNNGSQFILVVEAAEGVSGAAVGESLLPLPPDNRPDLQVQSNRPLGNGSMAVCDVGAPPQGGGIPAVDPPSYGPASAISDALNDFACRFEVRERAEACTIKTIQRVPMVISPQAEVQYCNQVAATAAFPPGDTVLTAKVRDSSGQLGPAAQIVVRIKDGMSGRTWP